MSLNHRERKARPDIYARSRRDRVDRNVATSGVAMSNRETECRPPNDPNPRHKGPVPRRWLGNTRAWQPLFLDQGPRSQMEGGNCSLDTLQLSVTGADMQIVFLPDSVAGWPGASAACCPASAVCCHLASSAAGDCRQELASAHRKSMPHKNLQTFLTACRHTWHRLCSPKPSFRQLSKLSRRGLQSPNKVNEIRRIMLTGLKTTLHGPDLPNIIRPSLNDGRRNFGP